MKNKMIQNLKFSKKVYLKRWCNSNFLLIIPTEIKLLVKIIILLFEIQYIKLGIIKILDIIGNKKVNSQ